MSAQEITHPGLENVEFSDFHPPVGDLQGEVFLGLSRRQKSIPPKFFYDERGSSLFNEICRTEEYYLTRAEMEIFGEMAEEIGNLTGPGATLLEYGCGSSDKSGLLLRAFQRPKAYIGVDISKKHLLRLCRRLKEAFQALRVWAVCADYSEPIQLPLLSRLGDSKRLAFFPGSSVGNFEPREAGRFLLRASETVGARHGMLIGVDLKKDPKVLNAAYNDSRGITAAFNLNLLDRINRDCGADFDCRLFQHRAFYNALKGRVEMHLVSLRRQEVRLRGRTFRFEVGESIHTENSYKYSIEEFRSLAKESGWRPRGLWTDSRGLFSVHYLQSCNGLN